MILLKIFIYILSLGYWGVDFFLARKLAQRLPLFRWHYKMYCMHRCSDIPLSCVVPETTVFPHGIFGCFFSINAKIGKNCTILHHVTIGSNIEKKFSDTQNWGSPIIGDNVFIGAGAKVIGNITIGNNVKIGAGCIVVNDIPEGSTCVLPHSRILKNEII